MNSFWFLLIPAVFIMACSDRIDAALRGGGKLRRLILIFAAAAALTVLIPLIFRIL